MYLYLPDWHIHKDLIPILLSTICYKQHPCDLNSIITWLKAPFNTACKPHIWILSTYTTKSVVSLYILVASAGMPLCSMAQPDWMKYSTASRYMTFFLRPGSCNTLTCQPTATYLYLTLLALNYKKSSAGLICMVKKAAWVLLKLFRPLLTLHQCLLPCFHPIAWL